MNKLEIRCKKCNKLLAKMDENGSCKKIYLFCYRCKEEYEYTYKEMFYNRATREPNNK